MLDNIQRMVFDLPVDIIFDILSRLPVKSVIRFKSVCKTWYALIENPNFVETQKNKIQSGLEPDPTFSAMLLSGNDFFNMKKYRLLHFSETSRKPIDFELPCLLDMVFCVIVGTCNGLICASLSFDSTDFVIFNPTTRRLWNVPPFILPKCWCQHIFRGFGFRANGYELVRIGYSCRFVQASKDIRCAAEVYTMGSDNVREIEVKLGEGNRLWYLNYHERSYSEAVVIDGVFYWEAQHIYNGPIVVSFDIVKEVFDLTIFPFNPDTYHYAFSWHLKEIKKELALVTYELEQCLNLWVLKKDMNWTMIHRLVFCVIPSYQPNCRGRIRVLASTGNGKLVLENRCENSLKLFSYDVDSQEIKCLRDVEIEGAIDDVYLYTESLTPVN